MVYDDVCIRNSPNPILMDTHYSFNTPLHGLVPDFREITLHNVRIAGKGKITLDGYDAARCDVYYRGELSPDFYGWVFPHGATTSVGTGTAQIQPIESLTWQYSSVPRLKIFTFSCDFSMTSRIAEIQSWTYR